MDLIIILNGPVVAMDNFVYNLDHTKSIGLKFTNSYKEYNKSFSRVPWIHIREIDTEKTS